LLAVFGAATIVGLVFTIGLRLKDLRMRRIVACLEWVATNTRSGDALMLWERVEFSGLDLANYVELLRRATFQDLRAACRLASQLERLSLFPIPGDGPRELPSERKKAVLDYHFEFLRIAQRVLPLSQREVPRDGDATV
jgi:hypothetical protein